MNLKKNKDAIKSLIKTVLPFLMLSFGYVIGPEWLKIVLNITAFGLIGFLVWICNIHVETLQSLTSSRTEIIDTLKMIAKMLKEKKDDA